MSAQGLCRRWSWEEGPAGVDGGGGGGGNGLLSRASPVSPRVSPRCICGHLLVEAPGHAARLCGVWVWAPEEDSEGTFRKGPPRCGQADPDLQPTDIWEALAEQRRTDAQTRPGARGRSGRGRKPVGGRRRKPGSISARGQDRPPWPQIAAPGRPVRSAGGTGQAARPGPPTRRRDGRGLRPRPCSLPGAVPPPRPPPGRVYTPGGIGKPLGTTCDKAKRCWVRGPSPGNQGRKLSPLKHPVLVARNGH